MGYWDLPLEVTPLEARGQLGGFLLVGRWPKDTTEWAQFLLLAVQVAAAPGMLPGLPHLGLTHRAAWIEADSTGRITRLASSERVDPMSDADTAVLSTLIAA